MSARRLEPVGWAAIAGALVVLAWSVPGIIVNPDFAIGDDATSKRVLGADMNGWHALSGFLVAIPALVTAFVRPYVTALYCVFGAAGLIATGVWALMSTQVAAGLFYFPNNEADAILHFATSAIWLAGAGNYFVTADSGRSPIQ
jgi:hypothetical protein